MVEGSGGGFGTQHGSGSISVDATSAGGRARIVAESRRVDFLPLLPHIPVHTDSVRRRFETEKRELLSRCLGGVEIDWKKLFKERSLLILLTK